LDVVEEGAFNGRLVSFADYKKPSLLDNDFVLLNIGDTVFLQYNYAKGYNIDVPKPYRNEVVITRASGALNISTHIGIVSIDRKMVFANFEGGEHDMVIEVCAQGKEGDVDYTTLSVYLVDGIHSSTCSAQDQNTSGGQTTVDDVKDGNGNLPNGKGPLIVEDEWATGQRTMKESAAVIGIIWAVVVVLLVTVIVLLYRYRRQKKRAEQSMKEQKRRDKQLQPCETTETFDSDIGEKVTR